MGKKKARPKSSKPPGRGKGGGTAREPGLIAPEARGSIDSLLGRPLAKPEEPARKPAPVILPPDEKPARSDLRLLERAVRERWPINPEHRATLVRRLEAIAYDKNSGRREVIAAIRVLGFLDKINVDERIAEAEESLAASAAKEAEKGGGPLVTVQMVLHALDQSPAWRSLAGAGDAPSFGLPAPSSKGDGRKLSDPSAPGED